MIWVLRHNPRIDPMFHKMLMLDGDGKSIIDWFMIFASGWDFMIFVDISCFGGAPARIWLLLLRQLMLLISK